MLCLELRQSELATSAESISYRDSAQPNSHPPFPHLQFTSTAPTCYTFPYPHFLPHSANPEIPFVRLVSHGPSSSREPGLLLAFPSGKIWYWDNVSIALTFRWPSSGKGGSVRSGMLGSTGQGMGPVKGTEKVLAMEVDEGVEDQVADVWVTEVSVAC